jgi:hypothetical protein
MLLRPAALLLLATVATPALAANSAPQPVPIVDTIPAARDVPYPGTMILRVDATDLDQNIFSVQQTIPVAKSGQMTLLFPEWLPGNHAPRGQVEKVAGLVIKAGGKVLRWQRDPVDVYAYHIDVPSGARALDLSFKFLSATAGDQGRIVVTREMLNIQWEAVSFYPAGYFTRQIPVTASVTYPAGWQAATALRPTATATAANTVTYGTVSYEILVDSRANMSARTISAKASRSIPWPTIPRSSSFPKRRSSCTATSSIRQSDCSARDISIIMISSTR